MQIQEKDKAIIASDCKYTKDPLFYDQIFSDNLLYNYIQS